MDPQRGLGRLPGRDLGPEGRIGKLKEAARAWALARLGRADETHAASIDEDVQKQFALLGARVEIDEKKDDAVLVWDSNWNTLEAFLACSTTWRRAIGWSGVIWEGLRYADLGQILDRYAGVIQGNRRQRMRIAERRNKLFDDLRVMESAALKVLTEQSE